MPFTHPPSSMSLALCLSPPLWEWSVIHVDYHSGEGKLSVWAYLLLLLLHFLPAALNIRWGWEKPKDRWNWPVSPHQDIIGGTRSYKLWGRKSVMKRMMKGWDASIKWGWSGMGRTEMSLFQKNILGGFLCHTLLNLPGCHLGTIWYQDQTGIVFRIRWAGDHTRCCFMHVAGFDGKDEEHHTALGAVFRLDHPNTSSDEDITWNVSSVHLCKS